MVGRRRGRTSLVFLDGRFSHAVTCGPCLAPESGHAELVMPDSGDRAWSVHRAEATAEHTLAAVAGRRHVAYSRVDLMRGRDGRLLVSEVELVEPFLFLAHADDAADRLAAAVALQVESTRILQATGSE